MDTRMIERPDAAYLGKILNAAVDENNPRGRARKAREAYDYLCKHYEQYIESLITRIGDLEEKKTILAEIISVKQMVAKLSET